LLHSFAQSLVDSSLGVYIAESTWAFPTLESLHVIAIVTVVGTIAIMDLRLLGLASNATRVTRMSSDTLPWTWGAFGVAAITGGLLFVSKATNYTANPYFLGKMALIAAAGVNMAIFHLSTWRSVDHWDANSPIPTAAKIAGGVSLSFWIVAVFLARVIGFTLDKYG
jgi:hypothetical protein